MTPEVPDYKGFMTQLKLRRATLKQELDAIDAVIGGMERMARIGVSVPGLANRDAGQDISKNLFSADKPAKAVLRYLNMVSRRVSTANVVQALKDGGVKSKSDNPYSIVYTALSRLFEKDLIRKYEGPQGVEWSALEVSE